MGKVAALLGRPFMPWQQAVADVVFELDAKGRLVYREVVLTVPRQSGKTLLELAAAVHRGLATKQFGPRQRMVYTAQKRKAARKKWDEDFVPDLEAARALRGKYSVRRGYGDEGFTFANGSTWSLEAGTETAGHGSILDLAFIDEAFAQVDGRLQQAFDPAMLTRPQPQTWIVSTMGWEGQMPYLWSKILKGRDRCEQGLTESVAYFEWSAPDDADPEDPRTWWGCMPALGHTQTEDAVAGALASSESVEDFCRAYLNQPKPKPLLADEGPFAPGVWDGLADPRSQIQGVPCLAVDVTPERSWTSVGAAGLRPDGLDHVELIEHRMGTGWVPKRALELCSKHDIPGVSVDPSSPAGSLIPDLEAVGVTVFPVTAREMGQACGLLVDQVTSGNLRHLGDPELDAAVAGARKKNVGDAQAWSRKNSSVDISSLVAVTIALLRTREAEGSWMVSIP